MKDYICKGDLNLSSNYNLTSLKGLPKRIGGDLNLSCCISLESLNHGNKNKVIIGGYLFVDPIWNRDEIQKYFKVDPLDTVHSASTVNVLFEMLYKNLRHEDKEKIEVMSRIMDKVGIFKILEYFEESCSEGNQNMVRFLEPYATNIYKTGKDTTGYYEHGVKALAHKYNHWKNNSITLANKYKRLFVEMTPNLPKEFIANMKELYGIDIEIP